jgi:hypothetical protein
MDALLWGAQVADGAAVLCGFGYDGTDKWNGVNNMDILDFEFAEVRLPSQPFAVCMLTLQLLRQSWVIATFNGCWFEYSL